MFTKESLMAKLLLPLPGIEAQFNMAPSVRAKKVSIPNDVRIGAVMILLYIKDDEWHTLFIERAKGVNVHSGQIAFPGGKKDNTDENTIYTALRECEEEVGIPMHQIEVLGTLTDLYIPPSNFIVSAVVGFINELPSLVLSQQEVENTFEIKLKELFLPSNKSKKRVQQSDNKTQHIEVPIYKIDNTLEIWGATAMILAEFEHLILEAMDAQL